jgi:hypothetical protein
MSEPNRKKARRSQAKQRDDEAAKSNEDESRQTLLMKEAAETPVKRKSIHQAIVSNPDGARQAANSHQSPFAVVSVGGTGAEKYQDMVLAFLDPTVWDRGAPVAPGEDGDMRARPEQTRKRCRRADGSWRKLICCRRLKEARYIYLGTYEIETEFGDQCIGEYDEDTFDDMLAEIDPEKGSDKYAGKKIIKALKSNHDMSHEESLEWLNSPKNWRLTPIRFVGFDCELFSHIVAMEERNRS